VLPELGTIGANGLANPRHFEAPVSWYENKTEKTRQIAKLIGKYFECELDHSPFNVIGWYGNYHPFKYNLDLFNVISTCSWDHPDPSLYSVL